LRVWKDSFEVGTNVSYAEIHQTGGKVPEKVFTNVKVRGFWVRRHKRKGVNVKRHYVRPFIKGRVVIKAHTIAARPYLMLQRSDKTNIVTLYSEKGLDLK